MILNINKLSLSIENRELIKDFDLQLENGEIIGIFMPSGSGKTTLLNYISENFMDQCKISYAYQDLRLLENVSVEKNLEIPLRNQNLRNSIDKKSAKQKIQDILSKIHMESKKNTAVRKLSGGEKQKVSLARALIYPSDLVLLDECFVALDEAEKQNAITLTKTILETEKRSCIIVSHDIEVLKIFTQRIITSLIS